jgi:hypothetical protein
VGSIRGAGSFGMIAAVLIALAAVVGFALFSARLRKRRLSGMLIGIHATLAISGFVVLIVYVTA